jgi:hypothetical protein
MIEKLGQVELIVREETACRLTQATGFADLIIGESVPVTRGPVGGA